MKITIEQTNNGFIAHYRGNTKDDPKDDAVYQEKDDNKEHVIEMLYDILEYFGIYYSKHNEKNIKITYEDNLEKPE